MASNPSLKQLETLVWVARLGSFHAAAMRLNASQPAISIRIRELERSLGIEAFDRGARSARLTPKGRELFRHAERLLATAAELRRDVGDNTKIGGVVLVGAVDVIALSWLPRLWLRVEREYPGIQVELVVDSTFRLRDLIRDREIDLAFVVGPGPGLDIAAQPIGAVQLEWMASTNLRLPRRPLDPSALSELPIISDGRGTLQHALIHEWFRAGGTEPRRINICNSLAISIQLTIAGLGISLLAPSVLRVEQDVEKLKVIRTTQPTPRNKYVMLYSRTTDQAATSVVARLAREVAGQDPAFAPT